MRESSHWHEKNIVESIIKKKKKKKIQERMYRCMGRWNIDGMKLKTALNAIQSSSSSACNNHAIHGATH